MAQDPPRERRRGKSISKTCFHLELAVLHGQRIPKQRRPVTLKQLPEISNLAAVVVLGEIPMITILQNRSDTTLMGVKL